MTDHFSAAEMALFDDLKGQKITQIIYHEWRNNANPTEEYAFVDKIEWRFERANPLIVAINEADSGMVVLTDYDYEAEKRRIAAEFGETISLMRYSVFKWTIWVDAVPHPLLGIKTDMIDNAPSNRALYWDFGDDEKRVVYYHPEQGLLVEIFEEDDED